MQVFFKACKPFFYVFFKAALRDDMQQISTIALHLLNQNAAQEGKRNFGIVPASRANALEPEDTGTFILPMKQSFMKNRRIMDSTARMISLLAGWAGQGIAISTTQGIIAKHIGKSVRQVQRMLLDAWREGYLTYSYTKSRIGMITGIKIFLRFNRILKQKDSQIRRKPEATLTSDTNRNSYIFNKDQSAQTEFQNKLKAMCDRVGIEFEFE